MADKHEKKEPEESLQPSNTDDLNDFDTILDGIDELPPEAKTVMRTFAMMGIGHLSQENAIAKKINEEHITNYLDGAKTQMINEYKERRDRKIFIVILVALALGFMIWVIFLLKDNPDVLEKIIYSVAGLVAGAFGGYGIGRRSGQNDDD